MKVLLLFNPKAGNGRAEKLLPKVRSAFAKNNVDHELVQTEYRGHGTEIISKSDFSIFDGIVAAGGDGTLFEVINGYFKNRSEKRIPLGVLPVGTGNAFARDLELDISRWEEAVQIISQNNPRRVDVGKFSTQGNEYYYLNIIGAGFVAEVNATAQKLKMFGNLSYTLGVLYQTGILNSHYFKIEIDGQKIERDSCFIEISNTRYTANFLMAPAAQIDDGLLDVTLAGKLNRRKLLQSFPKIFTGEHVNIDEIETFQAQKIKIDSDKAKALTPDGELVGETPVEIECLKQAIEVFWK